MEKLKEVHQIAWTTYLARSSEVLETTGQELENPQVPGEIDMPPDDLEALDHRITSLPSKTKYTKREK